MDRQSDDEWSALGDAELVALVRSGRDEPYAELFRRHRAAALNLARGLTDADAAEDVVSEAFEKLLLRIRDGGGPDAAFRPYLLRTVRTVAVDGARRTRRLVVAEDPEVTGAGAGAGTTDSDELFDGVYERTTLGRAFAGLPQRWQAFLWLSFVEDADRDEIGRILGVDVGGVSALGYRAREGLRRAFLDAHLRDAPEAECERIWPLLSGAVRGGLSPAQRARVDQHVAGCEHCAAALAELEGVNTRLGAVLAPLVLGAAAPAYLAGTQHGAAALATAPTQGALTASKVAIGSLAKLGAAGVAVIACVSTVSVVGILAVFTAPLGNEPSPSSPPGQAAIASRADGPVGSALPTGEGSATGGATSPGDPTTAGSSDPTTTGATGTGSPTSTGVPTGSPTPTGQPTSQPTSQPTGQPTIQPTIQPTGKPTGQPTSGPTTNPTVGPTGQPSAGQTPTGGANPTVTPSDPPSSPTGSPTDPSTSPTQQVADVDARVGAIAASRRDENGIPIHVTVPVTLTGGSAGLQLTLDVVGLTKFRVHTDAGFGSWSCTALTALGGKGKTSTLRCTLPNAAPTDTLALGIDFGYVAPASMTAHIDVLAPDADSDASNDDASASLPVIR